MGAPPQAGCTGIKAGCAGARLPPEALALAFWRTIAAGLPSASYWCLTYVFISHDLNVVEYISDRVLVMYLGQVVESCASDELYQQPLHPYTRVLLSSIPKTDPDERASLDQALGDRTGEIPSPLNPPSGCRFRTRCPSAMEICAQERPAMRQPTPAHDVACFLYESEVPVHA